MPLKLRCCVRLAEGHCKGRAGSPAPLPQTLRVLTTTPVASHGRCLFPEEPTNRPYAGRSSIFIEAPAGKKMQEEIPWRQIFRRKRGRRKRSHALVAVSGLLKMAATNVLSPCLDQLHLRSHTPTVHSGMLPRFVEPHKALQDGHFITRSDFASGKILPHESAVTLECLTWVHDYESTFRASCPRRRPSNLRIILPQVRRSDRSEARFYRECCNL
jgi:hypothetical protein